MLKSSLIFKTNSAQLVEKNFEKTFQKKKNYPLLGFECFGHAKQILICVKL
jgi:hypothetical protein